MSGAQGLPQRMTAFLDPKTGLVTDTWWRFLNALFQRTGGAQATTGIDDVIQWGNMTDTSVETPPEDAAWLALAMADVAPAEVPEWMAALLADTQGEPEAIYIDPMADTDAETMPDPAALLAVAMSDTPAEPENDPALVAMMVSDS